MSTNGDPKKKGRPPKPINSARSVQKQVYLTLAEAAHIERDAADLGLSQSDLIRAGALSYRRLTKLAETIAAESYVAGLGDE